MISQSVLDAIRSSPDGLASLDVLDSLGFCDRLTLKTTISRLNKSGRIMRLKRGVYSVKPMRDALACAQDAFNGYLGFSTAMRVHGLISEIPFTLFVVTPGVSKRVEFGDYEFQAVALGSKAVGFEKKGIYVVSSRAKTLFDCIYLPRYAVERAKLFDAFSRAGLTCLEWKEFDSYVERLLAAGDTAVKRRMIEAKKAIISQGRIKEKM